MDGQEAAVSRLLESWNQGDGDLPVFASRDPEEVLALDEALGRLEALEPRQSQVVALKTFVGLTNREVADALGIGLTAVKSDWRFARAWLERELGRQRNDQAN